jgi:hypothetical protein
MTKSNEVKDFCLFPLKALGYFNSLKKSFTLVVFIFIYLRDYQVNTRKTYRTKKIKNLKIRYLQKFVSQLI